MFKRASFSKFAIIALSALVLAGCGTNPADSTDPSLDGSSDGTSTGTPGYVDPSTGTSPYTTAPTPIPVAPLADMTATVTTKKNGSFLGLGAYKCTVEVNNPNSVPRTGTLTVTFMDGSKQSATAPAVQQVSIPANGTQDFDFSDPKWSTNDVSINLTSDAAAGATAAYGATTGAYGSAATMTSPYGLTRSAVSAYSFAH